MRLPTRQWKRLKTVAAEEGLSLAGLVSAMAEQYLQARDERRQPEWNDSFFRIGDDPGHSGSSEGSENHDALIHSTKPRARTRKGRGR